LTVIFWEYRLRQSGLVRPRFRYSPFFFCDASEALAHLVENRLGPIEPWRRSQWAPHSAAQTVPKRLPNGISTRLTTSRSSVNAPGIAGFMPPLINNSEQNVLKKCLMMQILRIMAYYDIALAEELTSRYNLFSVGYSFDENRNCILVEDK